MPLLGGDLPLDLPLDLSIRALTTEILNCHSLPLDASTGGGEICQADLPLDLPI